VVVTQDPSGYAPFLRTGRDGLGVGGVGGVGDVTVNVT
jgi:hypothetical protein